MNQTLKIQIIIGSTRQGRFSEIPAKWIFEELKKKNDIEPELIDLRDYPLPFFDEPMSPSMMKGEHPNEIAKRLAAKVSAADGFIIVSPEYNHGYSAVLKNALDYIYYEWNKKPVGFISYGGVGGARAIVQLREVVVELQMISMRNAISIPGMVYMAIKNPGADAPKNPFESLEDAKEKMLEELIWYAKVMKAARTDA